MDRIIISILILTIAAGSVLYAQLVDNRSDAVEAYNDRRQESSRRSRAIMSEMSARYTIELADHKRDVKRLEAIIAEKDAEIARLNKKIEWWETAAQKIKLGGKKNV